MTPEEIITDEEISRVHGFANFGNMSERDVVNFGVLKCACGYYQGSTSRAIITEHRLINKKYLITQKGREYLWAVFGDNQF